MLPVCPGLLVRRALRIMTCSSGALLGLPSCGLMPKRSKSASPRSTMQCSLVQVTAMHLAAEHGHFALITLLMEHGGDATALDGHRCGFMIEALLELQLSDTSISAAGSPRKAGDMGCVSMRGNITALCSTTLSTNARTPNPTPDPSP